MENPLAGVTVAVFGSSEPREGSGEYEVARRIGGMLAGAGARVASGGYGGVMEAASRGCVEAGGATIGITCSLFAARSPNTWLTEVREGADLFERTRLLIDESDAFIILPGKSGTLAELAFLWALDRAGALGGKPIVLCGTAWRTIVDAIEGAGALEPAQRLITSLETDPGKAVAILVRRIAERREGPGSRPAAREPDGT